MTQLSERLSVGKQDSGKKAVPSLVTAGAMPQVNLLPESVRAVRRLRNARGWFGLAVLASVVLVVLGWFGGTMLVSEAQDAKTIEEQRTSDLLAQKAQFAEVTPIMNEVERVGRALFVASGSEVLWADYTGAIAAVLPEGVQLQTLSMQMVGTDDGSVLPTDPLVAPGLFQLTFEAHAATAPNAADLVDSFEDVPGFSDARVTVVDRVVEGDFAVTGTVQVTSAALSLRLTGEAS